MKSTADQRSRSLEAGLTLLEMVVVMAILAAVTTLAIRATSGLVHETRYEVTGRSLDAYRAAVIGQPASIGSGLAPQVSSFAADMGRLPRTVLDGTGTKLTLQEIFSATGNPDFAFRTAVETNTALVWDTSVQGNTALNRGITANVLQVPCGWRGPYLYASPDQQSLMDGWGKAIQASVGTTNSLTQFWQYMTNGGLPITSFSVATASRAEIAGIAISPGASGSLGMNQSDDPYLKTQYAVVNLNEISAQVIVQLNVTGLSSSSVNLPPKNNLYVDVRVFGPNSSADVTPNQPIRCVIKRINYDSASISASMTVPFLIGPKVVICEIVGSNGSQPTTAIAGFSNVVSSATTYLQPGVNFVQVGIAVN